MILVEYSAMKNKFNSIFLENGVDKDLAEKAAEILTDNTCDGVASHGVNRFSIIIEYIKKGYIKPNERAEIVSQFGAIKVVDGKFGLGVTNAWYCVEQAMNAAKEHGIGCVAMRNNNHWMRGATYGLQAARAGFAAICFTNTIPNMPAWGAKSASIGNNPLIIAVPNGGSPVLLDMAMSQFSYGKLETTALNESMLPIDGGYNKKGELTKDPKEIIESRRILPAGFWKGSGLSIVLDMLASVLSGGNTTKDLGDMPVETGVSQIFIAIDPAAFGDIEIIKGKINSTIAYIKQTEQMADDAEIYYPGEQSAMRRQENMKNGIPVNEKIWEKILEL